MRVYIQVILGLNHTSQRYLHWFIVYQFTMCEPTKPIWLIVPLKMRQKCLQDSSCQTNGVTDRDAEV